MQLEIDLAEIGLPGAALRAEQAAQSAIAAADRTVPLAAQVAQNAEAVADDRTTVTEARSETVEARDEAVASLSVQSVFKTADHTLAFEDEGKTLKIDTAAPSSVTIPTDAEAAFPVGALVSVMQIGAGAVSIMGAPGVTLEAPYGLTIPTRWAVAVLHKHAPNTWVVLN